MIAFIANAAGTALTGLDSTKITMTDTGTGVKTIELGSNGFASADYIVVVTTATADTVAQVAITDANTFVINTFDCTDGTTAKDAICHVLVIGSDVADRN
jgi:flavoprotein